WLAVRFCLALHCRPLFMCIAFSELAFCFWKVPSHSLRASSLIENISPGPASYMTTVKSLVGPLALPTGPTVNAVAEGKVNRLAAAGRDAVRVMGTAVYSSGVADTKNAKGSLISIKVGDPPVAVVKTSDANVACPTRSNSQPTFGIGQVPLPM